MLDHIRTSFCALLLLVAFNASAHTPTALTFIPNLGQWDHPAAFQTSFNGGMVFLESDRFTYSFLSQESRNTAHYLNTASREEQASTLLHGHAWSMSFVGGNTDAITGKRTMDPYHNYFLGNDPTRWRSNVPLHQAVHYAELYADIDLFVHSSEGNFKYDFWVEPGANPADIALHFDGLDTVELNADGTLRLETSIGDFLEGKPFAYQLVDGQMVEVPSQYVWKNGDIGFAFPEGYDPSLRLVIDPELIASTLSGSTGEDNYGHAATFDIEGNIYTGARSFGAGYPSTAGAYSTTFNGGGTDCSFSKLSPDGSNLIWAAYMGGNSGENPHSMVTNEMGELFVYCSTDSPDFPALANAFQPNLAGDTDMAIAHVSADGTVLMGCTYVGGSGLDGTNAISSNYGDVFRGEIILSPTGEPIVMGCTASSDFPVTSGAYQTNHGGSQDAALVHLNTALTLPVVISYLGGTENDSGYGVRIGEDGTYRTCGSTMSADFPTTTGAYQTAFIPGGDDWTVFADAFVAIFDPSGASLNASTLYGTESNDQAFFLDLDTEDNIWIYGQGGPDLPEVGTGYSDSGSLQFVTRFNTSLTNVLHAAHVGSGAGATWTDFIPIAFLVDACDNIYVSSHSATGGLSLTDDALNTTSGFYLAAFSPNMEELEYGTYYTGNHVDGGTSRFDKNGTVYQAVCSGGGFETTTGAWAEDQIPWWDIGVFKIDFDVSGVNAAITGSDVAGCAPFEVTFSNFSDGDNFVWDFGDGITSEEFEPVHTYDEPGVYEVSLIVTDSLSCNIADTSYFPITISQPEDFVPVFDFEVDCEAQSVTTINQTGIDWLVYEWDMGDGTLLSGADVVHIYDEPGTYNVSLVAIDEGCQEDSTVTQEVIIFTEPIADFEVETYDGCAPFGFVPDEVTVAGADITWDFGDGSPVVTGNSPNHTYTEPGTYQLVITAEGTGACSGFSQDTAEVTVIAPPFIEAMFVAEQSGACEDLQLTITNTSVGDDLTYDWFFDNGFDSQDMDPEPQLYANAGTYYLSLTVTEPVCFTEDIYTLEVLLVDELPGGEAEDFYLCPDFGEVTVTGPDFGAGTTWEWAGGEQSQSIVVTEPGTETVQVTFNNCQGVFDYEVQLVPDAYEVRNWTACEGTQTVIEVNAEGSDYNWCTGETEDFIVASDAGEYCFTYTDIHGCTQEGLVVLEVIGQEANFWVPNAFSPNSDGVNDVFAPVGETLKEYKMSIWNRWGDVVFESVDQSEIWLGNYQGSTHYVPDGIYTYRLTYDGQCSAETVTKVGTVTIVR